jgi:hypothetical protein
MVFHFYFGPPKTTEVTQKQVTGVIITFIGSGIYDMRKQKIQIYLCSLWIPCHHGIAHPQVADGKECSEDIV